MKYLGYKGYAGSIEYSQEDKMLFGKVLGMKGLISYERVTGPALEKDFRHAIDEYLKDCEEAGISPMVPFKGSFNVRINPSLHKDAVLKAEELKTNLNDFVSESIRMRLGHK
jgi:predicted HicB family RNase H-like nuclease